MVIDKYQICTRCVMDTSDPQISFDEQGVCNHCHEYDRNIAFFSDKTLVKSKLNQILAAIKESGKNKPYDCIIGVSGGVDSTYVAYLVKELGLKPLAVHLDNGWNSELAVKNIENTLRMLNIELYTHVINWDEFKDIQLAFLKASTPDSEIPTDHAIFTLMRKIAKKFGVKYIISGINKRTESHHATSWSQGHLDWKYIKSVHRLFGKKEIKTFPHGNFLTLFKEMFGTKWINILDYVEYNKADAKKLLVEKLNWRDYGGKHFESIYTRFFQGYILPVKFGYDKRKMHLSSLICAGETTREQALGELKERPYPLDMQDADKEYAIKKFDISKEEFEAIMQLPPKTYYDYPSYYGKMLTSKRLKALGKFIKKLKHRK